MGLRNYFKPAAKAAPLAAIETPPSVESSSDSQSIARLSRNSRFPDEIKYEVILNHLFQRQCSSLWIDDISGFSEGTVVRKSKGVYMCCPPALEHSPFTEAMCALNVQVSHLSPPPLCVLDSRLIASI